jgi:uncharacterized repeat protein (TIGR02543 family)
MPVYKGNQRLKKPFTGSQRIKQAYVGNVRVFTSSNMVYYHVDTGNIKQEEVDYGASTLSPKTFTPVKTGYSFVGWSGSATSHNVLSSNIMGDNPVHLYAVFRQNITVTYYNGNATASTVSDYRRYNNGTVINPSFTLTQKALSGWTARGWSTGTAGNSGITYGNGAAFTRDSNITLYGMYQQTVTVTYYNGSTSALSTSGTKYYNSNGNVVNPSFTLTQATLSGWTARGWSAGTAGNASVIYNNGVTFTRDSSITLYGMYQQTVYLYTLVSGSKNTYSGNRYYNSNGNTVNPAFTVSNPSLSGAEFKGWSSSAESSSISYSTINNTTFASSTTLYAVMTFSNAELMFSQEVVFNVPDHWEGTFNAPDIPCYPAIDCSKYSGFEGTIYGHLRANGNQGNCKLVIVAGGTELTVAHSYWDGYKIVEDNFERPVKNVKLTFTQTSGMTNIYCGGRLEGYHAENDGFFWIGDASSKKGPITLIGRTVVG